MSVLRGMGDVTNPTSFSNRMRSRRFAKFEQLCQPLARPLRIIDIGGTQTFWEQRGWAGKSDVQITLINLMHTPTKYDNLESVVGDATNLSSYANNSFDIAFSNSVIEHLFNADAQRAMAKEVQRVAPAHWIQTPNFWFPMEPHFHLPGWQWLPINVRAGLIRRWECGQRGPYPDPKDAMDAVREIRLLSGREMRRLFPTSTLWSENFYGLTKSWVAYGGFPEAAAQ